MNKDEAIKFLEQIDLRYRTRKSRNNKELLEFLENLFPNISLNYQILSLMNTVNPYCVVCNLPVKTLYRDTCSTQCREVLKKKNNTHFDILQKSKISCLKRYGVENPSQADSVKKKRLSTMIEKYCMNVSPATVESSRLRAADLNKKGRISLFERYGVNNPGQLPGHYSRVLSTMNEKYGVDHYSKTDIFKDTRQIQRQDLYNRLSPDTIDILDIDEDSEKIELYENPNKIIKFNCRICNITDSTPSETFKWRIKKTSTPCLNCSGITKGSLKESEIRDYILSLGLEIQRNIKILDGLEIDIFIPSLKLGIEFNGLFWHNDTRVDKNYHINKTQIAQAKGIRLIHIFEDEWEHRKEIVKARLKNICGLSSRKLYARKCEIKEIQYIDEYNFLEDNHIQGYAKSSIKLGLYHNDELVSVMTFSRPNLSKGSRNANSTEWELLRFASVKDTNVVGGASRLYRYFIKIYSPSRVISFSDKRWNTGDLYSILGFSHNKDTNIGYWYIDLRNIKRIHRFGLRKNINDIQDMTEYENRLRQGYLRIWDCGNSKWEWVMSSK